MIRQISLGDQAKEDMLARLTQTLDSATARGTAMPREHRPLRTVLIAAAVAALMVTAAMAFSPTFRDMVLASLGFRASYATEVLASCEDQGITIEAQSALTDGRVTRLFFTVHDPSGVFFLEDTRNDLWLDFLPEDDAVGSINGREGNALERLYYDEEKQTALYVFRVAALSREDGPVPLDAPAQAKLTMSWYLPGYRQCWRDSFSGPMPFGDPDLPLDTLKTTVENGTVVLLPNQTPHILDEEYPEYYISSMGFDEEGRYHVRVHADPGMVGTRSMDPSELSPFHVYYDLFKPDGKSYEGYYDTYDDAVVETQVSDGYDYCFLKLTRKTYPRLGSLNVYAFYSVAGGYRQGNWELTVPLEQVEARTAEPEETLILSATKDSPPPSGENHEAQVASVSVSPISVAADFVRPENYHLCADLEGKETACVVNMADGSTIEPTFMNEYWSHNGRVVWEFNEEIDPSQVVSVALNDNLIPFSD